MALFQTGADFISASRRLLPGTVKFLIAGDTLRELEGLMKSESKLIRTAATSALGLTNTMRIIECKGHRGDDAIITIAKRKKVVVATSDSTMRRILRDLGIPVIYPRKHGLPEFEGSVI